MKKTEQEMLALQKKVDDAEKAVTCAKEVYEKAIHEFRNAECPHPKKYVHGGMFYTVCNLCSGTLD